MTCKDCIHSGLCYKENDYENFPDRCGEFISDKVLEERPQGEWIDYSDEGYVECPLCQSATTCEDNIDELHYCWNCGAHLQKGSEKE